MKFNILYRNGNQVTGRIMLTTLLAVFVLLLNAQDIASPSDNVLPKKENLAAKIKRYESSGYKIAVYQNEGILKQRESESMLANSALAKSEGMVEDKIPVSGESSICGGCIENKTEAIVSEMNDKYGTSVFEAVDISKIPTRTVMGQSVPDWWSTKYKSSLSITVSPVFDALIDQKDKKLRFDIIGNTVLTFVEFHKKKGKPRQKIIANSMNNFLSVKLKTEEEHTAESAKALKLTMESAKGLVSWPTASDVSNLFSSGYDEAMTDFMKKLSKK